jgi:hypothetical protein
VRINVVRQQRRGVEKSIGIEIGRREVETPRREL